MKRIHVSIEIRGEQVPVGYIDHDGSRDGAMFRYAASYLERESAFAISVSLPLRPEPFSSEQTKNYFEGLLPEGFTRRSVAAFMRVDEGDYLSILSGIGQECLGALQITEEDTPKQSCTYQHVSEEQMHKLAEEGAAKSAEIVTKTHLSLTGASGKVGMYFDEDRNEWFLPTGDAPSTHILKQSHVRLDSIVVNEQLAMMTGRKLGLEVPHSFIVHCGGREEKDVLFATKRYDRYIDENSRLIGTMRVPYRLHQEDFAQALGIPAAEKYERTGEEQYLKSIFALVRRVSADPIRDQMKLWDAIIFNYLVGNTDGHIKNFSLLYSNDLRSIRVAPLYDIVSTCVYESSTRDMAFSIGGAFSLDEINRDTFEAAAKDAGLGRKMALQHFDEMAARFPEALEAAAADLTLNGFVAAADLKQRILENGGIASCM